MDEATADLITEALTEAIQGPRRVRSDAGEVEQHSLGDLIKAEQHALSQIAVSNPRRGIRFARQIPPGAI
jgi:hypothetical protein